MYVHKLIYTLFVDIQMVFKNKNVSHVFTKFLRGLLSRALL